MTDTASSSRSVEPVTCLQSILLEKVKNGLDLPKDASNREEVFQEIKEKTTAWVAKYRRGAAFQGRPSYKYALLLKQLRVLPCQVSWPLMHQSSLITGFSPLHWLRVFLHHQEC